ncbi:uncharacterized protein LOC102718788 [Oryza brachyantha]|uniref:uncharacterized protein LOC102718788 n=1 Tax=Oryza brachyantha TaxID=4533 RepID=UPI001ADCB4AC|nr:uncharacterized protein LOC102718788 [Oryza brachyantha]
MATPPESLSAAAEEEEEVLEEEEEEEARGLLYEAYNELQGLAAELGSGAAPAPAVVVVGHQTDGKSALVEALMGFQFNHVGGGTKTRRPVALHLRFNPRCHVPHCRLLAGSGAGDDGGEESGVACRAMPLADIQAYIEAENMRLENDPSQFSEKEIIIRIEYKHCPNLTIIDTPGLILPAPGRKNRLLQSQACAVETLVRGKIKHKETIILCLEDCSDWSNATTRRVVMQVDPDLARTVIVSTKLDTKIPQFARASDVEVFLHPPTCVLDGSLLGDSPFFTSVPSGRVGSCHEAVFRSNEEFKKAISLRELEDVASLEDKLGRGLTKEEKNRIGVGNLRLFLEELLKKRYIESVPLIIPLLEKEHRGAARKLREVAQEISDLDEAKMKEKARLFHDSFLSKLSLLLKGMVVAPPDRFGETLVNERINGGTFTGSENFLIPNKLMPNAGMRLYGGAQYHRAMAEFRLVVGSMKCPPITREEIVNACGVEDIHDGTNYSSGGGGGREVFFHTLDRVPSGLHIDADFPSDDDDDDDDDDVRVSFASATGDHNFQSFRRHQAAVLEDDDEEAAEEEDEDMSKYDMWMSDEHMSIQERRRRLHQGLGLASSRDLALRRHSTRKRMVDIPRSMSKIPPVPSPAAAPTATVAPTTSARDMLMRRPEKPIARRRSDSCLAVRDGGVSVGSGKPPPSPSPSMRRARSLPARHAASDDVSLVEKFRNTVAKRDLPAVPPPDAAPPPVDKGRAGDGDGKGGSDANKNQQSGKEKEKEKEVTVVAAPKDAGASNTQTGVQLGLEEFEKFIGNTPIVKHLMRRGQSQSHSGPLASPSGGAPPKAEKPAGSKKKGGWLKNIKSVAIGFIQDKDGNSKSTPSTATAAATNATPSSSSSSCSASSSERLKVHQSGKSCKELTGLYMCQEIQAHEGSIWSIKFSADGRRLASAGEDSVVRVWQVVEASSPPCSLPNDGHSGPLPPQPPGAAAADGTTPATPALAQLSKKSVKGKSGKDTLPEHLVVPDKVFALADQPECVLEGHQDDVLDLTWSKSDQLLSSSMDKTVRLWDTATKACLKMFAHNDYVTCIQFNPVDDRFFISGSLDAKVRLWSIPDRQVVDWTDLNEMVTAASYTPDGQGAIFGSHKGSCRFYKTTDCKLSQEAQIDIQTKKRKSQAKKITGFQFAPGNPSEVLVTSADSQIRVFDGVTMVQKFRGFKNTSSQISAAYTSDGRYVVCASEDSHVYLWRAARGAPPAVAAIGGIGMKAKTWCTTRSFENFYCKDVSAAVPWPLAPSLPADGSVSGSSPSRRQGASCNDDVCSMASHAAGATKPPDLPSKSGELSNSGTPLTHSGQLGKSGGGSADGGNAWGLVVVTASLGGEIRVYQNFGMPFRIRGQGNLFY